MRSARPKGIAVYSTTQAPYDLVHTGGNFMCDGAGTAFSSELVLDENGANGNFNQTVRNAAGVDAMMEPVHGNPARTLHQDEHLAVRRDPPHRHAHEAAG